LSDTSEPEAAGPSLARILDAADRESEASGAGFASIPAADYARSSCVQFVVGEIRAAVPLSHAVEIGRHPRITPLPNLPGWLLGVSNVRGEIVSMVDLAAFLGLDRPRPARTRRFIVVRDFRMRTGLVVDRILGIRPLEPPARGPGSGNESNWHPHIREEALADGVLHIIDVPGLLASPEMNAFHTE
jgi:purine-binding chemotaxis protein CheW